MGSPQAATGSTRACAAGYTHPLTDQHPTAEAGWADLMASAATVGPRLFDLRLTASGAALVVSLTL
jgi:hypothetical protein